MNQARARSSVLWARGLVVLAMLCVTATVFAADDTKIIYPSGNPAAGHPPASATPSGSLANTLTLVVALLLAAAGAWVFLKNRRNGQAGREGKSLAVEETKSLGNRQYLVVASYEGRKFLLGVCPGRIDMLSPLNERRSAEDRL